MTGGAANSLLFGAVLVVLVILGFVYRAPLLALAAVVAVGWAYLVASSLLTIGRELGPEAGAWRPASSNWERGKSDKAASASSRMSKILDQIGGVSPGKPAGGLVWAIVVLLSGAALTGIGHKASHAAP